MKFSIITAAAATLLFSISGLAQVTVFRDVDFSGPSETLIITRNECHNFGNGWNNAISSVILEEGFTCKFFSDTNCDHTHIVNVNPGRTHFTAANDQFSSYICN